MTESKTFDALLNYFFVLFYNVFIFFDQTRKGSNNQNPLRYFHNTPRSVLTFMFSPLKARHTYMCGQPIVYICSKTCFCLHPETVAGWCLSVASMSNNSYEPYQVSQAFVDTASKKEIQKLFFWFILSANYLSNYSTEPKWHFTGFKIHQLWRGGLEFGYTGPCHLWTWSPSIVWHPWKYEECIHRIWPKLLSTWFGCITRRHWGTATCYRFGETACYAALSV